MPDLVTEVQQLVSFLRPPINRVAPLLAQPFRRLPYSMPSSQSLTIPAGATNVPFIAADYQNALEWDFEIWWVKFSQDLSHTSRDWRFRLQDNLVSQELMKNPPMVATLVDDSSGLWKLEFPWIVPKKGGGLQPSADNLDTANPINVDINFIGFLLIPRRTT